VDTTVVALCGSLRGIISPQQVKQQRHPRSNEQNESDPDENVKRFLLRRRSVNPNRHMKTTNQTSQESHRRLPLGSMVTNICCKRNK
jgi:hypothetical protein